MYRLAVHQLSQLRKRLVRGEIRLDNHSNDRIRDRRTRRDAHSADQRVDADQCRNLSLFVREGVVQLRCPVDELPVRLLPVVLRESLGAVLTDPSKPRRRQGSQAADR
jgi:hypothetical protein